MKDNLPTVVPMPEHTESRMNPPQTVLQKSIRSFWWWVLVALLTATGTGAGVVIYLLTH